MTMVTGSKWSRLEEMLRDPAYEVPHLKDPNSLCFVLFGWEVHTREYDPNQMFNNREDQFFHSGIREQARVMLGELQTARQGPKQVQDEASFFVMLRLARWMGGFEKHPHFLWKYRKVTNGIFEPFPRQAP